MLSFFCVALALVGAGTSCCDGRGVLVGVTVGVLVGVGVGVLVGPTTVNETLSASGMNASDAPESLTM